MLLGVSLNLRQVLEYIALDRWLTFINPIQNDVRKLEAREDVLEKSLQGGARFDGAFYQVRLVNQWSEISILSE